MWLYENQFWVEDDLSVFSSYYLSFCSESNSKKKEISNDINQFFIQYANIKHPKLHNEKNIINFYDLAISMVSIFYIDATSVYKNNFIDNKAIALYQLSKTSESNFNDKVRTSYIRYLLYNSYLYDARFKLKIKNNRLYFKSGKYDYILFLDILNSIEPRIGVTLNNKALLNSILSFLKELTIFFEKGAAIPIIENMDDIYLKYAHYSYFIPQRLNKKIKKTPLKTISKILTESITYGGSSKDRFITSAILFNYINLNYANKHEKIRSYWEKSVAIDNSVIEKLETTIKNYFDLQFDFYPKQIRLKLYYLFKDEPKLM